MANPFVLGALGVFTKGPGETQDNVTSLGDGEAKIIHVAELTALAGADVKADVILEPLRIKTGAANWIANDTCSLYLLVAEDATGDFTDGIDETSNVDISASIVTAAHIATIATEANTTTYYFDRVNLSQVLGIGSKMPSQVAIVLWNKAATAAADLSGVVTDHNAGQRILSWA